MNKKIISASVLMGLASAASAVHLNPDGLGQVLLYPYYTTNAGKDTAVTVVNTTSNAKAVKVRFKEGVNSWEVLDFNLYLSPWDVWTGTVTQNSSGDAFVWSTDTSCIAPRQLGDYASGGVPFRNYNMADYGPTSGEPSNLNDADGSYRTRMTEGYLEMIEMGTITQADADATAPKTFTDIKHVNGASGRMPGDCEQIQDNWRSGGIWATNPSEDILAPSGGLFGTARIIDVQGGSDRGYDAVAIDGFWVGPANSGAYDAHSEPGTSYPDLAGRVLPTGSGSPNDAYSSKVAYVNTASGLGTQVVAAQFPDTLRALSAVLMVDKVYNQYMVDNGVNAQTDWVINFPTKHAFVNRDTSFTSGGYVRGEYGLLGPNQVCGATIPGYVNVLGVAPFTGCYAVGIEAGIYDNEENYERADLDFSPRPRGEKNNLSYEVNVIEFAKAKSSDPSKVFGSHLKNNLITPFDEGWAVIDFIGGSMSGSAIDASTGAPLGYDWTFAGYPVIGFASLEGENGTLDVGGVRTLANYAELYNHKYDRVVTRS